MKDRNHIFEKMILFTFAAGFLLTQFVFAAGEEDKVLAEGADVDGDDKVEDKKEEVIVEGDVKTGDTEDVITESEENPELDAKLAHIRKLAGIK